MLPRAKTGSKRLHRCKLPPAQHVPNELTESFDHWEGRFLRDLSSHRRRSVRGGRLGLVKGCPHVLHAAWLWPPSGHAWQPETACGGTVTRLSDTQRSNFCCALHSWQAQSRARAPVCVLPFASKRDYLRARQREPTFVYVLIDGGSCSTAARQCDYLDCQ